jgi:hypothetical protein
MEGAGEAWAKARSEKWGALWEELLQPTGPSGRAPSHRVQPQQGK